jgi:hypothetical protein
LINKAEEMWPTMPFLYSWSFAESGVRKRTLL